MVSFAQTGTPRRNFGVTLPVPFLWTRLVEKNKLAHCLLSFPVLSVLCHSISRPTVSELAIFGINVNH